MMVLSTFISKQWSSYDDMPFAEWKDRKEKLKAVSVCVCEVTCVAKAHRPSKPQPQIACSCTPRLSLW